MSKAFVALALLLAVASAAEVTIESQITFYGFPDNSPPSSQIAYTCNGRTSAGGSGTYDDPVSVAVAPKDIWPCTLMYIPYLQKYGIADDECEQCISDFSDSGAHHIDVWTGGDWNGGQNQIDCEDQLTPNSDQHVVLNPPNGWNVVTAPLFNGGCTGQTYPDQN